MQDRSSLHPGRVKLIPVSGQEHVYDMVRADEPEQEGTPLSKATFLTDETAALFGLGSDAVPDEVFQLLAGSSKIAVGTYKGTGKTSIGTIRTLTFDFTPKALIVSNSGKGIYNPNGNDPQNDAIFVDGGSALSTYVAIGNFTSYANALQCTFSDCKATIELLSENGSGDAYSAYGTLDSTGGTYHYIAIG